jgi:hypothetical protein
MRLPGWNQMLNLDEIDWVSRELSLNNDVNSFAFAAGSCDERNRFMLPHPSACPELGNPILPKLIFSY